MFLKENKLGKRFLCLMLTMFLGMGSLIAVIPQFAMAATTELTITKLAVDGVTVLDEKTVSYKWLRDSGEIAVMGDGVTRYYHQGPVFIDNNDSEEQERLRWNEEEDQNWDTKDMGAVRGTNLKDLCELVGGMVEGDKVKLVAQDNMAKTFAYKNVYQYNEKREGPMVICWEQDGQYPDGGYTDGMRLVWFAGATHKEGPTSLANLPTGDYHVFGNYDWYLAADPEYHYYYSSEYPTTTGLSVQRISKVIIYSNEPVPEDPEEPEEPSDIDVLFDGTVTLNPNKTFIESVSGTEYSIDEDTPLGALQAAASASNFDYALTNNRWDKDKVLLLNDIGEYKRGDSRWYAYVNDVFKDGYQNEPNGLNVIKLQDGDRVEFYYVDKDINKDLNAVKAAATAAVKIKIKINDVAVDPSDWEIQVSGARFKNVNKTYFESGLNCPITSTHHVTWTDENLDEWGGMPLWLIAGMVDDVQDIGNDHINFNDEIAAENYQIKITSGNGSEVTLNSVDIARDNGYLIVNTLNGEAFDPEDSSFPLVLTGEKVSPEQKIGNIARIELLNLPEEDLTIPELRIVKYGEDHTTIVKEYTLDYREMEESFNVIGDGETVYKYQGVTFNPEDIWDENEIGLGDFKIENAVKGTLVKDLCELVDGMGAGTDIIFVAKDGWQTKLPYSSIYTDPSVQARQGDAIIAWWADGDYVPYYGDGMRLFFTPEDGVYSQMDMRETLPEDYWHYYGAEGIMYPSCAGLSAKYITEIRVYTKPQGDWSLELDGLDLEDGLYSSISKTYFESGLTCTFGANHKASYTDSKGSEWEGMPLWLLIGFVDDADQHSYEAFNRELAEKGYQVVITASDGYSVTIDSKDIDRKADDYIIANSLNGALISEGDKYWPLRLVGSKVSGKDSIGNIVSIKLISSQEVEPDKAKYKIVPKADTAYRNGTSADGINTMTVNAGNDGLRYFTVDITPIVANDGKETVVFSHLRDGMQLGLNATRTDFDVVGTAQAGFNVKAGDVIKAYIVDRLTNDENQNPIIFQ